MKIPKPCCVLALVLAASAAAQSAGELRGAAAVEPLTNESPAKIVIDPPLAEPLSHRRVVIQYRSENLHFAPVFESASVGISPHANHQPIDQGVVQFIVGDGERIRP